MRGRIETTDVIVALSVIVTFMYLAPVYSNFINNLLPHVGPLSGILLQIIIPGIAFAIVISIGVSAVQNGGETQ